MSKQIKSKNINRGAWLLTISFVLLFFVVLGRFLYIQIGKEVQGQDLEKIAEEKWTKQQALQGNRGKILDRNGVVIAEDIPKYSIYAILKEDYSKNSKVPLHIVEPRAAAVKLAPLLDMDVSELERILSKESHKDGIFQVEFGSNGRNIPLELKEKIESLNIPGIYFTSEMNRHYPNGTFASHVIGYALPNEEGDIMGEMGIELQYDELMTGSDGKMKFQSDRKGFKLPDPKEFIQLPQDGNDVYLTIDQKIQTFLEAAVSEVEEQYKPEQIIAIVADPKTGEILGMSTRPSFDPNVRNITNYRNEAVAYRYEPGSTMKVFTLAAAINEGKFPANEFYQSGTFRLSERYKPIKDHNGGQGWGQITYLEGIQRSSNVAVAKIVNEKLGTEKFYDYLVRFGFDRKTGIDLPNEVEGKILWNYPIEKITTSFGQGTTITPIQQIQAMTAIANEGKMMRPYIVKKIVDPTTNENVKQSKSEVVGEPVTAATANEVKGILETVVTSPNGTGKPYKIEDYSVAGKTGTAQIPNPEGGGYLYGHGNYFYSFLGLAPVDDPRLIMYVSVKQPELEPYEYATEPVSHIFNTVMENSLHYLNITPTEEVEEQTSGNDLQALGIEVPELEGESVKHAISMLEGNGIQPIILGDGKKIEQQLPFAGSQMIKSERVIIRTDGNTKMPDLTGWAMRDVLKVADLLHLKPNLIGSGYVTKQNIQSGAKVSKGDFLVVEFEKPNTPIEEEQEIEEDLPVDVPEGA
ncbi:penicillin-binding protein [Bacillus solimangrovi]|uniref:serine-type D-Ala-D-Ala carboxypeptidase n=1 Tax=Bacillus solimangrovi TaxID=1305675 RepID=A0A1E5LIP4_9BACI|nr:penicillin-binding protein [Bacillus solimangrovi]OEH93945.1 penicillin-binding protein [Bacillus solimangrovi]